MRGSEISKKFPLQARQLFAQRLVSLLDDALGMHPGSPYKDEYEILEAVSAAMKRRGIDGDRPDRRTLDNWRKGDHLPLQHQRFFMPLLDVLCGSQSQQQRDEILVLWQAARTETYRVPRQQRGLRNSSATTSDEPWPLTSEWEVCDTETLQRGLAELLIYPPPLSNVPDQFQLRANVALAQYPDEIEGWSVKFGLKEAMLFPQYEHCQPVERTRIGEDVLPVEHLVFKAGVWHVTGPRVPKSDHLEGEPVGPGALCVIQCNSGGEAQITLMLRSRNRALDVVPDDSAADLSNVKQKILQAFLQKCQPRDQDGFVTWARASLRRRKK